MLRLSYWVIPIIAGFIWLSTLLALLLWWILDADSSHYPSMSEGQQIAYISDVGAQLLKPLFVTGCVITTVLLDLSFGADRYLRHKGRLVPNTTRGEKILSALTIAFAVVGTVGLIFLSVFDTLRYPRIHNIFLLLFIAGYVLSAIFICCEYQRLGIRYRDHRVLRTSFWIKLVFVVVEILLAIAFIACTFTRRYNAGAVLEWTIAFIFSFYVFSFYVDLYPAVHTKNMTELTGKNAVAGRYASAVTASASHGSGSGSGSGSARDMEEGRIEGDRRPGSSSLGTNTDNVNTPQQMPHHPVPNNF